MSIGLGVFLVALGAVLSFAVSDAIPGVNLVMIGYICMAAGVATVILSLVLYSSQRHRGSMTMHVVERGDGTLPRSDPYGRP